MGLPGPAMVALAIAGALAPFQSASACDALIGTIITRQLGPAIEKADCPIPGLDKPGHKLVGVCYESAGATSKIKIDTALNCHASGESAVSKLLGGDNAPSKTENVSVEAGGKRFRLPATQRRGQAVRRTRQTCGIMVRRKRKGKAGAAARSIRRLQKIVALNQSRPSRIARTFLAKSSILNGLDSRCVPASSVPL